MVIIYRERILHGRAEMRNFSASVQKVGHEWAQRMSKNIFQHGKRNFVSPSDHIIFSVFITWNPCSLTQDALFLLFQKLLKVWIRLHKLIGKYIICRLGGSARWKTMTDLLNGRSRAAFSRPRSQFFTTRFHPKPENNFSIFFPHSLKSVF